MISILRKVIAILFAVLLILLMPGVVAAMGLGIGPSQIEIKDAMRGGIYEKTVTVFSTLEQDAEFSLYAEGDGGSWVTFHKLREPDVAISRVVIPAKGSVPVISRFSIPDDTPSGTYNCTIYVESIPDGSEEINSEVGNVVKMRMPSAVTIEVTGIERVEGRVTLVQAKDAEVGLPLLIDVTFLNTGNVAITPVVDVEIMREGKVIDRITHSGITIGAGKSGLITVPWNTLGQREGEFSVIVRVSLEGKEPEQLETRFKLLPVGTLASQGELLGIEREGEPSMNALTKIIGDFRNTGQLGVRARLLVEVYQAQNLVQTLESEEMVIAPGQEGTLTAYFKPLYPGEYRLVGRVSYSGKMTDVKEVFLTVPGNIPEDDGGGSSGTNFIPVAIAAGATAAAAVAYAAVARKGRKAKRV